MFSFWIIKLDAFLHRDTLKFYTFFKELRTLLHQTTFQKTQNNLGRDLKPDRQIWKMLQGVMLQHACSIQD